MFDDPFVQCFLETLTPVVNSEILSVDLTHGPFDTSLNRCDGAKVLVFFYLGVHVEAQDFLCSYDFDPLNNPSLARNTASVPGTDMLFVPCRWFLKFNAVVRAQTEEVFMLPFILAIPMKLSVKDAYEDCGLSATDQDVLFLDFMLSE
jgi:hypothetical protein